MLNSCDIFDDLAKYLSQPTEDSIKTSHKFVKIAERIAWLRGYFTKHNNISTTSLIKFIMQRFKVLFEKVSIKAFEKGRKEEDSDEVVREKMMNKIIGATIERFYQS